MREQSRRAAGLRCGQPPLAQARLPMLVKLGKRAWLHCDDCRHSIMIEPHEFASGTARHEDSVARDIEGNALHALRGAEGVLLAGAAQYLAVETPTQA